jgi:hypothetical protein
MALRIMDDMMTLEIDNRVVATASVLRGLAIGAGSVGTVAPATG